MEQFQERRRFPRIKTELFVRYKVLEETKNELDAHTKDISAGGVCLITRDKLPSGAVLLMEINVPNLANPVMANGKVVWSNDSSLGPSIAGHPRYDSGIEFVEISEQDRKVITEHVHNEQKKSKDAGWNIGIARNLADA